jgi:hypothetical protein
MVSTDLSNFLNFFQKIDFFIEKNKFDKYRHSTVDDSLHGVCRWGVVPPTTTCAFSDALSTWHKDPLESP